MSSAPGSRLSRSAFSFQLPAFHSACPSALGALLRKYFASGWAFLIPYLEAYLLYYWFKWPVNPGARSQEAGASSQHGLIPCLLHVYWTLHAINLTLGAIALCAWWRKSAEDKGDRRQESGESGQPASSILDSGSSILAPNGLTRRREGAKDLLATKNAENTGETSGVPDSLLAAATPTAQQEQAVPEFTTKDTEATKSNTLSSFVFHLSSCSAALRKAAPWLLLALVFYIPGVYLEFPADPWEHYARINEWSWLQTVGEHSAWTKSSYFLAYSLVGKIAPPTRQLFWLDFYYTGCCLLLCWQYYRLARAVGLGERASMFFVILQSMLFGNNIFGFYRYYGISSSIFAQMGAVALVRLGLEYAKGMGCKDTGVRSQESGVGREAQEPSALGTLQPDIPMAHEGGVEQGRSPFRFPVSGSRNWLSAVRYPLSAFRLASCLLSPVSCLLRFAASCALLLALCGFSHPQGLGIAGLGLAAVAVWRLIEWRRSMVWWLAAGTLVLSVIAILFFPRNPALTAYVHDGWLTSWYGFNIFSLHAEAGDRTRQIIGLFGLLNLIAGLILLRRNHLAGWLTIAPLLALSLPFIAIPLASALAQHGDPIEIITFQRLLFAIPPGLALVALGEQIMHRVRSQELRARSLAGFSISRFFGFSVLLLSLSALLLVPANRPFYNRFWQALMLPPDDLQLKPVVSDAESAAIRLRDATHLKLVTTPAVAYVFGATFHRDFPNTDRGIGQSVAGPLNTAIAIALSSQPLLNSSSSLLTHDPFAADPSAWTTLSFSPPDFVTGIKDFSASSTALQNPPGRRSDVFISNLIPIYPTQNYRIEFSARQCGSKNATAYFSVAWYNEGGRFLESYRPAPEGAGNPVGWGSGTYSYFGLIGETAPTTWTTFRISFGLAETAAIPSNAKFVRVGALLNYNATPAATIQLTNVRLWRKSDAEMVADGVFPSDERLLVGAPSSQMPWTYASQAGQASTHWPAQEVASDLAGGAELTAAARAAGGTLVDSDGAIFFVEQNGSQPTEPVLQEGTKR